MSKKYLMSSNQRRIYTLEKTQESSVTYNMPIILKLEKELDYNRLNQAFNQLCERHEAFRTSFSIEKDKFVQNIHPPEIRQIERIKGDTKNEMIEQFVRPFDLNQAPLIRLGIGKDQEGYTLVIIDVHHIISDGTSTGILLEELSELYDGNEMDPVDLHYKDFSAWQNSIDLEEQAEFWEAEFFEPLPETELPVDFKKQKSQKVKGNHVEMKLDASIKAKIEAFNKQKQTTSFMIYLTALMIFLTKLNRQDRVVIGTAAQGRNHPSAQEMIGMFVNTLPIIGTIDDQKNFTEILEDVKNKSLDVFENQDYPYEKIAALAPKNPIFDVMFSYEVGYDETVYLGGQLAKMEQIQLEVSKFDLTVTLIEHETDYTINWEYNTELFKEATIQRLADYFGVLLANLLAESEQPVCELQYLNLAQITEIKETFNHSNSHVNQEDCISPIEQFEAQVRKNPEKMAVHYLQEQLTYKALNERANAVAKELKAERVGKNDVVALIVEQTAELIVGILGILKAGAAYLPITPTTPIERINYIIKDSQAKAVLCSPTTNQLVGKALICKPTILQAEKSRRESVEREAVAGSDLAYIIYTSGSTGKPKGVMIENHSLMNLIEWQEKEGNVTENSVILQKAIYTFDASVWEIFLALLSGASLQMLSPQQHDDFGQLLDVFEKNHVTHFLLVPTFLEALLNYTKENKREKAFEQIEAAYVGAEKVTNLLLNQFVSCTNKKLSIIRNLYGPTEGTVCATYYRYPDQLDNQDTLIGSPIQQAQVYVMNNQTYCGVGIPGELCIGGAGVARGYLNQPELTAKQFVSLEDQVIYKTGDLGKYRADGSIDYLGRIDQQVKIRGFRVELAEVKQTLLQVPEVISAAVTVRVQKETTYLCAYIVTQQLVAESTLKDYLGRTLPDYMVPNYFIFLEKLPITANGKLDEKQLPEPKITKGKAFLNPTTETEEQAVALFKEILQLEKVNLLDSFYELGGDSIKAIRIVSKARELEYQLTVKEIMQAGTIKEIAQKMKPITRKMAQEMVTGIVPRSPIQEFFYSSLLDKPEHFNQSLILETNSSLDEMLLKKALDEIVQHHDLLRMTVDQEMEQRIEAWEPTKNYEFHSFQLNESVLDIAKELHTIGAPFQAMFTFERSPLLRILVFHTKNKTYLWVQMHHLIVDAVSWQIFIEDLNNSYEQLKKGQRIQLPQKTISYSAWSAGLSELTTRYEISKDEAYWQEINQKIAHTAIFDRDSPSIQSHTMTFALGIAETKQLRFEANKAFSTEISDLLLTALANALETTVGQSSLSITLEGHGREFFDSIGSVDRTIGWFTSMYPLVVTVAKTLPETIKSVKESIRKIPNKGMSYGLLRTYTDKITNKKTDVVFNYLGELGERVEGTKPFTISTIKNVKDSAKENTIGSPLSVNCYIQNGQLITDLVYMEPILSHEQMLAISNSYQEELTAVATYCATIAKPQKTASDLGELSWNQVEFDIAQQKAEELGIGEMQRIIPLTSMQEGLLYHKLLDETSTSYVIQCSYDVNGQMNDSILIESLKVLAEKHPALKTNIMYKDIKNPRQVIFANRLLESARLDFSKDRNADERFIQFKIADVERGFDLEQEALFRVTLVDLPKGQRLIFTFHHIIMDGWCLSIVLNDWMQIYEALQSGEEPITLAQIEPDTVYEDYARTVADLDKKASLGYWENLLEGYETQASFTGMYPKSENNAEVKAIFESLSQEETKVLQAFAKQNNVTLNTIVEAIWGLILQRYNHTDDVVFGKMVSGRNLQLAGIEQAVGLFINAIPVRVKTEESDSFATLVKTIQQQSIESDEHTYCSLSEIQNRSLLGKELIHTIVVFENFAVQEANEAVNLLGEMEDYREQTSYPISLSVGASDELSFKLMFDERLFTEVEAKLILSRISCALKELVQNPTLNCEDFSLVNAAEQEQVVVDFNPKEQEKNSYPTILSALKEQASACPEQIAVVFEQEQLTYAQLEEKSTLLAKRLVAADIGKTGFIGLYSERTIEMVVGIYGIMKAGAAYIPLSPTLPEERIAYILADSGIEFVLNGTKEHLPAIEASVLDFTVTSLQSNLFDQTLLPELTPDDKAYVIYTSGTTGNPKGVTVGHASLMNLVHWQTNYFELDGSQTILQQFSFIFDGSVFELFAGCLVGGTLEIISDEVKNDPDRFLKKLDQKILITVPSVFKLLLEFAEENDRQHEINQLSKVGLAGEATTMALVEKFYHVMTQGKTALYNLYGPTETTVCASAYQVTNQLYKSVPIGQAIANSKLFVFQKDKLCGIGMLGELCISGDNLALDYVNNPQTTTEKFVQNPVIPTERMYRSGDLVRWQEDGVIQYVGRIDEQVKIRGFRIELGEIENQLGLIPAVWDACVITRMINQELAICAYIVTNKTVTVSEIKELLKKVLPDYMVPAYITMVDKLPVTKAGKIDKRNLPEPEQVQRVSYEAPRDETEAAICGLFEELLDVEQVGLNDDFFELGGHSLKAVHLANGISKFSGVKVPLSDILQEKNVRSLAEKIKELVATGSLALDSIEIVDDEEL